MNNKTKMQDLLPFQVLCLLKHHQQLELPHAPENKPKKQP